MKTTVLNWTAATLLAMASLIACESESNSASSTAADATTGSDATGSADTAASDALAQSDASTSADAVAGTDASEDCGQLAWTEVEELFANNCGGCHSGAFKFNANTCSSVAAKASLISTRIENGSMPKGATLDAADKAKMLQWLGDGASCAVCP